ncbi:nuclear transport factor 2 family protein [Variovorax sp. WS11]|uniref:nuclear transport factor 2 family protein n=1 Tax=Variovorax sp. WS11 TaxID=1105204 RepID=UPI0013D90EEE|nr:nuclear transport factor 2 family protein [Variovorax sp. WS11]NDZ17735.1 nuclear transport factor 2 family protein [Variovorax sp. WS11]
MSDLHQRIDRLESRALIAEICTEYGIACDFRDTDKLASLFIPEIVIRSVNGSMNARGIDATMAMFNEMFKIRGPAYHWTHDRIVKFDATDPDRAEGIVLSHAETTPNGKASIAGLRYQDVYRRTDGQWKFQERVLAFLYYVPMVDYVSRLRQPERVLAGNEWRAADYPESDPAWQAWHAAHGR